MESTISAMT